jgi:acyl-CoA thioesterase-1
MISLRRRLAAILGFCALAAACSPGGCGFGVERNGGSPDAGSSSAPAAQPSDRSGPPARPRIVALGDSLTVGLGLPETQSYPSLLQTKIDEDGYEFEIINAGVSGDTSAGGLRRLDWALEGNVKVMILALGANDGLRGLPIAEMKQNLAGIFDRARA